MSQPKRYSVAVDDPWFGDGAYITEDGKYVLYSDYAALAADKDIEIKVLKDEVDCVREENAALAAEKEALVQQGIRDHGDWRSKLNFLEADYKAEVARLTAENERLLSKLSFSQRISEICKQSHDGDMITVQGCTMSGKTVLPDLCQCECLRAENERLRKAGDAMAERIDSDGNGHIETDDWEAAKEGRDAK